MSANDGLLDENGDRIAGAFRLGSDKGYRTDCNGFSLPLSRLTMLL